jgi:hypothetical protein
MDILDSISKLLDTIDDHKQGILFTINMITNAASTIQAVPATRDATREVDKYIANCKAKDINPSKKEILKIAAPHYIPTALTLGVSLATGIGAEKIAIDQITAVTAMYEVSRTQVDELLRYKKKAEAMLNEKEKDNIEKSNKREDKAKEDLTTEGVVDWASAVQTGHGHTKCYDAYYGRAFYASKNWIEKCVIDANYQLMDEFFINANELYSRIGLPDNHAGDKDQFCMEDGRIEASFTWISSEEIERHKMGIFGTSPSDERPDILVLDWVTPPRRKQDY